MDPQPWSKWSLVVVVVQLGAEIGPDSLNTLVCCDQPILDRIRLAKPAWDFSDRLQAILVPGTPSDQWIGHPLPWTHSVTQKSSESVVRGLTSSSDR